MFNINVTGKRMQMQDVTAILNMQHAILFGDRAVSTTPSSTMDLDQYGSALRLVFEKAPLLSFFSQPSPLCSCPPIFTHQKVAKPMFTFRI
jgi:hypothetical protein